MNEQTNKLFRDLTDFAYEMGSRSLKKGRELEHHILMIDKEDKGGKKRLTVAKIDDVPNKDAIAHIFERVCSGPFEATALVCEAWDVWAAGDETPEEDRAAMETGEVRKHPRRQECIYVILVSGATRAVCSHRIDRKTNQLLRGVIIEESATDRFEGRYAPPKPTAH